MKKTTIEHYPSLTSIDFGRWHDQGMTCLLLDVDSTITSWLGTDVLPEIAEKLQGARSAGFKHIGLITNSSKKSAERIEEIARQCGADDYFIPQRFRERKPSPSLIHSAIEQFGATPEQTAVVGDKYSADVVAAKRAGVAKVAWVDRLGREDQLVDRLIRRPAEAPIKMVHKRRQQRRAKV